MRDSAVSPGIAEIYRASASGIISCDGAVRAAEYAAWQAAGSDPQTAVQPQHFWADTFGPQYGCWTKLCEIVAPAPDSTKNESWIGRAGLTFPGAFTGTPNCEVGVEVRLIDAVTGLVLIDSGGFPIGMDILLTGWDLRRGGRLWQHLEAVNWTQSEAKLRVIMWARQVAGAGNPPPSVPWWPNLGPLGIFQVADPYLEWSYQPLRRNVTNRNGFFSEGEEDFPYVEVGQASSVATVLGFARRSLASRMSPKIQAITPGGWITLIRTPFTALGDPWELAAPQIVQFSCGPTTGALNPDGSDGQQAPPGTRYEVRLTVDGQDASPLVRVYNSQLGRFLAPGEAWEVTTSEVDPLCSAFEGRFMTPLPAGRHAFGCDIRCDVPIQFANSLLWVQALDAEHAALPQIGQGKRRPSER